MKNENTSRAFWIQEPGRGAIVASALREPEPGEVLVRTWYSGISRGTESLVFQGRVPASQHEAMRCPFQQGSFPAPVMYGYMSVGVVESGVGPAADELVGRTVFCLHPHQDRYVVPASAVTPVHDAVPPERAVLAANMETAVNGLWDAAPGVGDRVVVVGGGVVGMLVAHLARGIPGSDVTLIDPQSSRADVAAALGIPFAQAPPAAQDADLVIHASGSPDGLVDALSVAGMEARVVEMSWFGDRPVTLPLGEAFHSRRLTLLSSQVGRIPPGRTPRWSYARRMALALRLLSDSRLDALVTGESPFEDLPSVMERLARAGDDTLCHRIRYAPAPSPAQDNPGAA